MTRMAEPIEHIHPVISGIHQIAPAKKSGAGQNENEPFTVPPRDEKTGGEREDSRQKEQRKKKDSDSYEHGEPEDGSTEEIHITKNQKKPEDRDAGSRIDITV